MNGVEGFRAKQAVGFARRHARQRLRQGEAQLHQRALDATYGIRTVVGRTLLDRRAARGGDVESRRVERECKAWHVEFLRNLLAETPRTAQLRRLPAPPAL